MSLEHQGKPNRLITETSPYLLQHAYNPVDWYAWNAETLALAKQTDKPILLSIGYAACHWCHVMERESFENETVAAFMNAHFICIKVDREERPDVDQIYMDALQALTRQGGWPLNMFLTPDTKPFYGGTYFPPRQAHGRPSWMQALEWVMNQYNDNRKIIEEQAAKLTNYTAGIDSSLIDVKTANNNAPLIEASNFFETLKPTFEPKYGGFGQAPKFPNTFSIVLLQNIFYYTGNKVALNHAHFSLRQMIKGGIYDQLGGGFSRYSVDEQWLAPHFEKMLYDNALLLSVISDAYKISSDVMFKNCIEQTITFAQRELMSDEGGFYAALDADSEGVEGKYYVWTIAELRELLGEDAEAVIAYYGVTEVGNWEDVNILHLTNDEPVDAEFQQKLTAAKQILFNVRAKRVRPSLDDKIILCWNALMVSGLVKAYEALGNEAYLKQATATTAFLLNKFWHCTDGKSILYHTYKVQAKQLAFLDDYGALINALIDLYQVTGDEDHLLVADKLMIEVLDKFGDTASPLFFFTQQQQTDILYRKKDLYDSVTPSGNSLAAKALFRLSIIFDKPDYAERAGEMLAAVGQSMLKYTGSFGNWAQLHIMQSNGAKEVTIVGDNSHAISQQLNKLFIADKVVVQSNSENSKINSPLLQDRYVEGETFIYLCEHYTCQRPVKTVDKFEELLNQHYKS